MTSLNSVQKIGIDKWMMTAEACALMAALNAGGKDGRPCALFVGGCVRNALLGKAVEDIDIAATHAPHRVMDILSAAGFKTIPTGIEHGTITAVMNGQSFEITTLRKDVETDGRRAVVAFSDDWREDAMRRDFTMNTLLADIDGEVYDPLGLGIADLNARKVVFVGQAAQRIAEDHLRILRFFRFHALYGQGAADRAALSACESAADEVKTLSKERITQEFFKILSCEDPTDILNMMFAHNVLSAFNFEGEQMEMLKQLCALQNRYDLALISPRLLTLAGLDGGNVKVMEELLLLPKVLKREMKAIGEVLALPAMIDDPSVKVAIYKHGRTAALHALMIELAQGHVINSYARAAIQLIQNWNIPNFPISGNDLMKQGIKPGPDLGAKLHALEQEWIDGGFAS